MKRIIFYIINTLFFLFFLSSIANATYPPSQITPIGTPTTPPSSSMSPPTPIINDANITVDVQTKIAQANGLTGFGIMVSTTKGVVSLDGTVTSQAQADLAVNLAKSVPGVKDVQSKIVVKP